MKRRMKGAPPLSPDLVRYFYDDYDLTPMEALLLTDTEERDLWETWGPAVLEKWIKERPGTRPSLWWKYQAPRLPAQGPPTFYDGKIPEPRQRVGGVGRTRWEAGENWIPFYRCGLPASRDCWEFLDPNEPPVFESQASYLQRLGLLSPQEEEALKTWPEAFEPETLRFTTEEKEICEYDKK